MKKSLIYTKTGDAGTTSLVGGTRVEKTHIRLDAYGTVDELNSFVGWLACVIEDNETKTFLSFVQNKLFAVGSYLATETESVTPKAASIISEDDITKIETEIDRLDEKLPKLNRFVLPGGSEAASRAHICRSICRRAERMIYKVAEKHPVDERITRFVNRLSDYFFVLARKEANEKGEEVHWEK